MAVPPPLPPKDVPTRRASFARLLVAGVLLVLAVVYATFDPAAGGAFPRCAFHLATGLDCPGCGGQRALHALLEFRPLDALRANPLTVIVLPLVLIHVVRWLVGRGTDGPLSAIGRSRFAAWATLAVVVVFGIVRNLW